VRLRGLVGALEKSLGKRRPVIRLAGFFAHKVNALCLACFGKASAQLGGRVAAANDDDGIHVSPVVSSYRLRIQSAV